MGTILSMVMIILFLVLLAFVFSTALLTPIIGKKNLLFVIFLGFTVGLVGGAFFISPVIDEVPDMARAVYEISTNGTEVIKVDVTTDTNIQKFIEDTRKIEGVKSVQSSGIIIETAEFSEKRKKMIEEHLPYVSKDITSSDVYGNHTLMLTVREGADPKVVIEKLKDWLMLIGEIHTKYSVVHVTVNVEASKVDEVLDKISGQSTVIVSIKGPVEDKITNLKGMLPDKSNVILFCGFIGVLTGLAGVFIDGILRTLKNIRDKIKGEKDK